jgi:glycosyltransferase involved in cell wall biosynthesis
MPINISVIICSYNREAYIKDAMISLLEQDFPKDNFEAIVVDNNSIDNTEQVCKKFIEDHPGANFYYLTEKQQGSSPARNKGATVAKGELLIFMDDDAIAEKDFLKNTWKFYAENKTIQGFGGRIIPRYIPSEPNWMSKYVSALVGNFNYADTEVEFEPNKYPLESNMAVTKTAFDEVGGFNTALPGVKGKLRITGEGKDFYFRVKEKGHRIFYVPGMVVHHVVEVEKLTSEYLYRVASGIGRGERRRIEPLGIGAYRKKVFEYLFKFGASIVIGFFYLVTLRPAKSWPVIQFRIDALKGLMEKID